MYNTNCPNDQYMDAWAKCEVERVANNLPTSKAFWMYVKFEWLSKTKMWVVGNQNFPYARQYTNAAIKNYHANLKATLHSSKGRFHRRWVDWAIHATILLVTSCYTTSTMHYKIIMGCDE
jgi:hypothetical protein